MTKPLVGRPLGSGLAALVLVAVALSCTNSGDFPSSAPSPAHTEPSDPAALFESPPDNRFDAPGTGGAVGIYIDAPPGRVNFATVLASAGIYFRTVGVITNGEEGRAIVIRMAQAQADHLRAIG
jgi:hypothetical protein